MKRPALPKTKPVFNMLTLPQVEAILTGVEQSAFSITMSNDDSVQATLSVGEREVFVIDLTVGQIRRRREGNTELVFTVPPSRFLRPNPERRLFERLGEAIKTQYALGGEAALSVNLITRHEVMVFIDAIRAMAFQIERSPVNHGTRVVSFEGRQCFRIDTDTKAILMVALSGTIEVVYTFADEPSEWFWAGTDRKLWRDLTDALAFFDATMHKVRMSDYRALFGNQMQKVITGLANAMEVAEADIRMLEKVDKTRSGSSLHPEVARLVQKDLQAGEEAAQQQEQEP